MEIDKPLFEGNMVCLAPINREKDAEIEAKWTQDSSYLRMLSPDPARPLSPFQVKKRYQAIEKKMDEDKNQYYFTIRMREDDRLIGFARISWIGWANGHAVVQLGIGDAQDRGRGYGQEALSLLLCYAFEELNMYRVSVSVPEYNQPALGLFTRAGFVEEVRRREALNRDGRFWDVIHMGLLRDERERNQP